MDFSTMVRVFATQAITELPMLVLAIAGATLLLGVAFLLVAALSSRAIRREPWADKKLTEQRL